MLDEGRTDTECRVGYYNDEVYEVYRFTLSNGTWTRGGNLANTSLASSGQTTADKTQSGPGSYYTKPIAKLYNGEFHDNLRDTWYMPSSVVGEGKYSYVEQYQTDLPNRAKFIEGEDISNDVEVRVRFEGPWEWQRFDAPTGSEESNFLDTDTEIYSDGEYYAAQEVKVKYKITENDIGAPSIPQLNSPDDGSFTSPSVTLDWNASSGSGTITYRLQVDDNAGFSSPHYDQECLTSTS